MTNHLRGTLYAIGVTLAWGGAAYVDTRDANLRPVDEIAVAEAHLSGDQCTPEDLAYYRHMGWDVESCGDDKAHAPDAGLNFPSLTPEE